MSPRSSHTTATLAICATLIACATVLSRAGDPNPPQGAIRSTMHSLDDIHGAITALQLQPIFGAHEFVLLVDEPANDGAGNPAWIDVVEGDGVLVRVLGTPTGTNGVQELRDGTGRPLGRYYSFPYDTELGIPFENGIQARPDPIASPVINLMLVYRHTPTAAPGAD